MLILIISAYATFIPTIMLHSSQLSCYVHPNYYAMSILTITTFIPTIILHSSQLLYYVRPNYHATFVLTMLRLSLIYSLCYVRPISLRSFLLSLHFYDHIMFILTSVLRLFLLLCCLFNSSC